MRFIRKTGISLLVPTQNAETTVEDCIRSFREFPDEMIVVDNGSTDNTIEIVQQLEREIPNLTFYNAPELPDLYQNRQFALERSRYNWIVRIDSDYVAYTEGPHSIQHLRQLILDTPRQLRPVAFGVTQVNLFKDYRHTGPALEEGQNLQGRWVPPPVSSLPARIIQHFPGMRFERRGRWEGVRFQRYLQTRKLEDPYWFHCTFKPDMDLFFRSERTNWRERGDFKRYPTLRSYVLDIIAEKYGTPDLEEACAQFIERVIKPQIVPYDESAYYPYPSLIREAIRHSGTLTERVE